MADFSSRQEIKVVRVQEGESGALQGRLTDERLEILTDYWSRCEAERAEFPLGQIAAITGLSVATVRKSQRDPRVLKQLKAQAEVECIYDSIEARAYLRGVVEAAKTGMAPVSEGVKAARTQLELSGDLKKGGAQVNVVNQTIHEGSDWSDEEVLDAVERVMGRRIDPDSEEA